MANALYDNAKGSAWGGNIDWVNDDVRAILVDTASYTVDLAAHADLADVPAGARVAVSGSLTGKTVTGKILDAADVTFSSVTGNQSEAVILYKHTGVEATSTLLVYIDTATGLPVTPNGGNINVVWNASGIVSL